MTPLKWFAGGSERRCEAMTIINHLLEDIKDTPQLTPLIKSISYLSKKIEGRWDFYSFYIESNEC